MDRNEDGADVVERRPLVLEDVEADVAVLIDVRMVARRLEFDRRRSEGIVSGEAQRQLVREALVNGAGRALDRPDPFEKIVALRESRDRGVSVAL